MTTWRLFPVTNGPASPTAFAGAYMSAVAWTVTQSGLWLNGYFSWTPPGGDTAAQKWALWQITSTDHGVTQILVPGSVVTGTTPTTGQWNFTALPAPIGLSEGVAYVAANGWTAVNGFPLTQSQFGATQPFSGGITNGPLSAYSDQSGSFPIPSSASFAQGLFSSTLGADPSAAMPATGFNSSNFWVDIQVTDQAPPGASYQIWPSQPDPVAWEFDTGNNFTLGTEFTLSGPCALNRIWFYSPPTVTQLPTECGIWHVTDQSLITATHQTSPAWLNLAGGAASAGDGWIYATYAGVTLTAGDYKTSVFNGAATPAIWSSETHPYWESPGVGQNGFTNGQVTVPSNATATAPGQSSYHLGTPFSWPDTHAPGIGSANYWVDVTVTPLAAATVAPARPVTGGAGRFARRRRGWNTLPLSPVPVAPPRPPQTVEFIPGAPQTAWSIGRPVP